MNDDDRLTTIDYLTKSLQERDIKIHELEMKVEGLEATLRGSASGWTLAVELPKEQVLPVPRLELVYEKNGRLGADGERDWREHIVRYRLVYRHLQGNCIAIPLGQTQISGGPGGEPLHDGKLDLPFRESSHIARDAWTLRLPAFAVLGDHIEEIRAWPPGEGRDR